MEGRLAGHLVILSSLHLVILSSCHLVTLRIGCGWSGLRRRCGGGRRRFFQAPREDGTDLDGSIVLAVASQAPIILAAPEMLDVEFLRGMIHHFRQDPCSGNQGPADLEIVASV